jgi:hypothetical protein
MLIAVSHKFTSVAFYNSFLSRFRSPPPTVFDLRVEAGLDGSEE